jgi:hypothetical protein
MSIPARAIISQLLASSPRLQAGGGSNSAKPKAHLALLLQRPHRLHFFTASKSPKHNWGAFRRLQKGAGRDVGWRGISLTFHLSTIASNSVTVAESSTWVYEIEGRGPRLRKENPRKHDAVWETKTRAPRVRPLPTDPLSCGNQPAHIRMIIVAAAALGLLSRSPRSRLKCLRSRKQRLYRRRFLRTTIEMT